MGHSQAEKAQSRERILQQAAAQVREAGLESLSVGPLMRSANLTHGGFYGHFTSRSDLLVQALARALADGKAASHAATDRCQPTGYAATVRSYLSRPHRDSRREGCAIAALASDVARGDEASRQVMETHILDFAQRIAHEKAQGTGTVDEEEALFIVSAMVGTLLVSRVITDTQRSDALLKTARSLLTD